MKKNYWFTAFCACILFVVVLPIASFSQTPTTQGKDFWLTFLHNSNYKQASNYMHSESGYSTKDAEITILISAKNACQCTISNPHHNQQKIVSVYPGVVTQFLVKRNEFNAYNSISDFSNAKYTGLHITSTDTVSVYASNFHEYSYDVTNVLPTEALQDEYLIQTYGGSSIGENEFVVMALEDYTSFTVKTTAVCNYVNSSNYLRANQEYTFTLNRGECRTFVTREGAYDLSGTYIKAADCKKLAVFVGNTHTNVPSSVSAADHLFEQAIPVNYWGKKYVVTSSKYRKYDRYRITSLENGCSVNVNGSLRTTLSARASVEYTLNEGEVHYIETSKPVAVYLYMAGGQKCSTVPPRVISL